MDILLSSDSVVKGAAAMTAPREVLNEHVDLIIRLELLVPAAVGVLPGKKSKDLVTGTVNSDGQFTAFTPAQYRFLSIVNMSGEMYGTNINGAADIATMPTVRIHTGISTLGKMPFLGPIVIGYSADPSYEDFFGNSIPTKIDIFNSLPTEQVVEIMLGLKLE